MSTLRTRLGAFSGTLDVAASVATASDSDEKSLTISLVSATASDLQVASFSLSASTSVPDLRKFELATVPGDWRQIWSGQQSVPTGTLATNESDPGDRVVPGNGSAGAHFEFDDEIDDAVTFTLSLGFTNGASSILVFTVDFD